MSAGILGRNVRIGKRWPYRVLNFLPSRQLLRYLTWKSGGSGMEAAFDLGPTLTDCRRLLILVPEGFTELLISLPVIQSFYQELPGVSICLLAGPGEAPFLRAMFGEGRVLALEPEGFYWGEDHFHALLGSLREMSPELILNLRAESPPLLQFMLRATRAPLRVELTPESHWPFHNVTLRPGEQPNHLRRYLLAGQLWQVAGRPIQPKWSRIHASPGQVEEAAALLAGLNLRPESTRIFLWHDQGVREQLGILEKIAEDLMVTGVDQAQLVVNSGVVPYDTPKPPPEVTSRFPTLQVDSTGALLGLFASAAGISSMNGVLLHLAGLTQARVNGFFTAADAVFDTSFLNSRLKIHPLPGGPPVKPAPFKKSIIRK